jgi:hypothetical protein
MERNVLGHVPPHGGVLAAQHQPKKSNMYQPLIEVRILMRGELPAHWEPQEEGVMSIAANFPSVKKPRFIVLGEER